MAKKVVLGGLLAGILVFFWGAFATWYSRSGRWASARFPTKNP